MAVYFVVIGLMLFLGYQAEIHRPITGMISVNQKNYKNNKLFVMCAFVVVAFVSAFRYLVGADYYSYYLYEKMQMWVLEFRENPFVESGSKLIALLNTRFLPNTDGVFVIIAAVVTSFLIINTLGKYSDGITLSLLLFIVTGNFTGTFNGIRQYMAAAILFAGHRFIVERKLFKWILVVLAAASFHTTALLMVFVYFITTQKNTVKLFLIYVVIAVALLFSYDQIFEMLGLLKDEEIILTEYTTRRVNIFRVLVQCVPLLMPFLVRFQEVIQDKETCFLYNISMLHALLAIASMNSAYFSRFHIYTGLFLLLSYPALLKRASVNNRKIITIGMVVFYFAYWYYETSGSWALNNFRWIFEVWMHK